MKYGLFLLLLGLGLGKEASASLPILYYQRSPCTFAPQANNILVPADGVKVFDKEKILNDFDHRVSDDFHVPDNLRERVSFWFDIYTKYDAQEQVIHHAMYPWIVYRIVNLHPILNGEGNRWVKYHHSVKFAKSQIRNVRNILYRLSKMRRFDKLDPEEQEIFDQLQKIPTLKPNGKNLKKIIREALHNVRTQVGQKDFVQNGLQASSLYMNNLENVFSEHGLPLELTRLPFVESSFNVAAVSKVGASGIWQVMPYIGRRFLKMNSIVDERNSPVKSSVVAAYLLKQNKQILKNWPLALTAYNHGAGSLITAIHKLHSYDLAYLIDHYKSPSFGFASQNFYSSFLAVLHAEKYKEQIFSNFEKEAPLRFIKVRLTKSLKIYKILELTGLDPDEFKKYNLDIKKIAFRKNKHLPRGYVLHIPEKAAETLLSSHQKIAKAVEGINSPTL